VRLLWQNGEIMAADEVRRLLAEPVAEGAGKQLAQETEIVAGGGKGYRYLLRSPGASFDSMTVSTRACGKRTFSMSVISAMDPGGLEQRIRESFVCKPDPSREDKKRSIDVELDAGPDFGLRDVPNKLLVESLDHEVILVVRFAEPSTDDEGLNVFMPKLLAKAISATFRINPPTFGVMTREQGPDAPRVVWRATGWNDGPVRLLAVAIHCQNQDYMGFYYGSMSTPEARGLGPLLSARCSDTPTRPTPITEVARAACARGDRRGCSLE
jgi:hypothetical protein